MPRRKTTTNLLILATAGAILSGCQSNKPKTVALPPPPAEKLVVHNLATDTSKKRHIVAAHVDFSNETGRSLDYVMFKTRAFDSAGREIPALKSGKDNAWLRIAGPLKTGYRTGDTRWEKVWNSADISCFRIEGAEVIFDDSSVEFYEMDQIEMDLTALQPAVCQPVGRKVATN